jgi:hypothetical protein
VGGRLSRGVNVVLREWWRVAGEVGEVGDEEREAVAWVSRKVVVPGVALEGEEEDCAVEIARGGYSELAAGGEKRGRGRGEITMALCVRAWWSLCSWLSIATGISESDVEMVGGTACCSKALLSRR